MIVCSLWSTIHSYMLKQSFLRPYVTTTLCQPKPPGSKVFSQFPKQSTWHCGPSSPHCPGQAPGLACSRHCSLARAGSCSAHSWHLGEPRFRATDLPSVSLLPQTPAYAEGHIYVSTHELFRELQNFKFSHPRPLQVNSDRPLKTEKHTVMEERGARDGASWSCKHDSAGRVSHGNREAPCGKTIKAFLNKETKIWGYISLTSHYRYADMGMDLGNPGLDRPFNIPQNLKVVLSGGISIP